MNLKELFEKEKEIERKQILATLRQTKNIPVSIFSKESVFIHNSLGLSHSLINLEEKNFLQKQDSMSLSVPKEIKIEEFILFISTMTNIPKEKIKLFSKQAIDKFLK